MKYIDKHSLLINDHIVLYKDGLANDIYRYENSNLLLVHSQYLKKDGIEYNLFLAVKKIGDKSIYYKYGVQKGYDVDDLTIKDDLNQVIEAELEKLKLDLLFDKARSER